MYRYLFIITFLLFEVLFAMNSKELANAINLAGKQRMLTQKMSKESLLIYRGVDTKISAQKLKKSYTLFDKTLNGLLNGDNDLNLVPSNSKDVEAKLKEVQALWLPFKKRVEAIASLGAKNSKDFSYIDKHNLELLKSMNQAVTLYTKLGSKGSSKLKMANDINLAGKQRMLTQMISKDLLLYQAGINPKRAKESLNNATELFEKTLIGLENGNKDLNLVGTKLPKIVHWLVLAKRSWLEVKPLIAKAIKDKKNTELTKEVISKLDRVKYNMNKAVELYAKSINRQKQFMKLNALISGFITKKDNSKHLINLAGKQRMLTQRVSKLSIECALNLRKQSCKKLTSFINLYEKTLIGFEQGNKELELNRVKNIEALSQINILKDLLKPFKESILQVQKSKGANKKALKFILNKNENLLKESNKLVTILVKNGSKNVSYIEKALLNIVNIAGRERMLTQKMTKEYLEFVKLKSKKAKAKMQKTIALFENSLGDLINGNKQKALPKVTNAKIKKQLLKVEYIWQKLKPLYSKTKLKKRELTLLLKANPILLKQMNKAVYMIDASTDY